MAEEKLPIFTDDASEYMFWSESSRTSNIYVALLLFVGVLASADIGLHVVSNVSARQLDSVWYTELQRLTTEMQSVQQAALLREQETVKLVDQKEELSAALTAARVSCDQELQGLRTELNDEKAVSPLESAQLLLHQKDTEIEKLNADIEAIGVELEEVSHERDSAQQMLDLCTAGASRDAVELASSVLSPSAGSNLLPEPHADPVEEIEPPSAAGQTNIDSDEMEENNGGDDSLLRQQQPLPVPRQHQ